MASNNVEHNKLLRAIMVEVYKTFGGRVHIFRREVGTYRHLKAPEKIIKINIKGQFDLWGFMDGGQHFEVEVKTGSGRLTKEQKVWQATCKRCGILAIEARSVKDAIEPIQKLFDQENKK